MTDSNVIRGMFEDRLRQNFAGSDDGHRPRANLKSGGGGGTSDSMSDDALKPRVDFLHTAFLWLAGALVTGLIAVVGINLTTANTIGTRIDHAGDAVSGLNRQMGEQSTKLDEQNRRLERMEAKIDRLLEQKRK